MSRERQLVELVDERGSPVGSSTVADAHATPGQLHRAFSVLLFDERRQTLLQQRAATKTRFPSIWANACCGHPLPGEDPVTAARRRLAEELGVRGVELADIGVHSYEAGDPATGRVEREYDHVLVGRVDGELALTPDPTEVATVRWEPAHALLDQLTATGSDGYAPWLAGVLRVAYRSGAVSGLP